MGFHMISPSEMEARFSEEAGLGYLDSIFDTLSEASEQKIERIKRLFPALPPREADFLELYYFKRMRQTDIAEIFGVSQPTVHYRLKRAADRMKFMLTLPDVEVPEVTVLLQEVLTDPRDVQIMLGMWETTCQSVVAKQLNETQGLVRHRFLRSLNILWKKLGLSKDGLSPEEALKRISAHNEMADPPSVLGLTVELFEGISQNSNLLREVQRHSPEVVAFSLD